MIKVWQIAIGTANLTRGCCFPFIDKRVGRITGVAIFEPFSFSIIIFWDQLLFEVFSDILERNNDYSDTLDFRRG